MLKQFELMGLKINDFTVASLTEFIGEQIKQNNKTIIPNYNLNTIYQYYQPKNTTLRQLFQSADYTHIDGMAVVLLCKWVAKGEGKAISKAHRVTFIDLVPELFAQAAKAGWRVYYLGSKPGVAQRAAENFHTKLPNLIIATDHGYFDQSSNSRDSLARIEAINRFKPHLLLLGMGQPLQEQWLYHHRHLLNVNATLCAGACFDYFAHAIPTPPRWLGHIGFEWLYRLICEPKRLYRRYLIEPWYLVYLLLSGKWKKIAHTMEAIDK